MKFYNERAKKVYPGLSFTMVGFHMSESRFLTPVKQVVAHSSAGESYYMPASFCRFVDENNFDLEKLLGKTMTIIERETVNGRTGLYVEGGN